jgi:hypothetical protein
MVIALLADMNVVRHAAYLAARMQAPAWREFWDYLQVRLVTFAEADLKPDDTDATVWHRCQEREFLLLTSNRSDDGPESLEATIRTANTPQSLPVFTLANSDEVLRNSFYAEAIVESLYDRLLRIDSLRGTGRLYLP